MIFLQPNIFQGVRWAQFFQSYRILKFNLIIVHIIHLLSQSLNNYQWIAPLISVFHNIYMNSSKVRIYTCLNFSPLLSKNSPYHSSLGHALTFLRSVLWIKAEIAFKLCYKTYPVKCIPPSLTPSFVSYEYICG